jgi:hypothetical protein
MRVNIRLFLKKRLGIGSRMHPVGSSGTGFDSENNVKKPIEGFFEATAA